MFLSVKIRFFTICLIIYVTLVILEKFNNLFGGQGGQGNSKRRYVGNNLTKHCFAEGCNWQLHFEYHYTKAIPSIIFVIIFYLYAIGDLQIVPLFSLQFWLFNFLIHSALFLCHL